MAVEVDQVFAGAMVNLAGGLRVAGLAAEISGKVQSHLQVSEQFAQAPYKVDSHLKASSIFVQVLMPISPSFDWIEMFVYEMFPDDISYNSVGATRFQTDVVIVDSGFDQRISRWDQPLMEYDVAYGVRTFEQLHALIAFFRAMQGRKNSFLYYDWVDHTSTLATATEARAAPPIGPFDQVLGVGDNLTYTFQLQKTYPTPMGAASSVRPIYKPLADTVMLGVGGQQVQNWAVDKNTGLVTFSSRVTLTNVQNVTLSQVPAQPAWELSAPAGTFSEINVSDGLILSGFNAPVNNTTLSQVVEVLSVAGDGSSLTFTAPAGFGQPVTQSGVTIATHPAPRLGQQVTAGFEFYVPVRFDTDRLPITLEEYGVGGAADVKLVEVRPNAN